MVSFLAGKSNYKPKISTMKLNECVSQVLIIYQNEDVDELVFAMRMEGFSKVEKVKAHYNKIQNTYTNQSKCLLAHKYAWNKCSEVDGLTIILEADFVPCRGIGQMNLPFDTTKIGAAWGWLYSCAQRVYEYDGQFVRGHSGTMVAYVLDKVAAKKIMGFVDWEFGKNNPKSYSPWDVYIRIYAQQQGVSMYLTPRSYGEHGGTPNPEHGKFGIKANHNADVLSSPLHFLPQYAHGSRVKYLWTRLAAYLRAWARLISGRYIEKPVLTTKATSCKYKLRMMGMAIRRLLIFR